MSEITPGKLADILESGKYQKGQGLLGSKTSEGTFHCCLGVYAIESGLDYMAPTMVKTMRVKGHASTLSASLRPKWMTDEVMQRLINLNDGNMTWADVISYLRKIEENEHSDDL